MYSDAGRNGCHVSDRFYFVAVLFNFSLSASPVGSCSSARGASVRAVFTLRRGMGEALLPHVADGLTAATHGRANEDFHSGVKPIWTFF